MIIDMSSEVRPGYGIRTLDQIIGIAVHHTATSGDGLNAAQEKAHVIAIDDFHAS